MKRSTKLLIGFLCYLVVISAGIMLYFVVLKPSEPKTALAPAASPIAPIMSENLLDTVKPPDKTEQPLSETDKSNIEVLIQISRQINAFDDAAFIKGEDLYTCLDYIYNDGYDDLINVDTSNINDQGAQLCSQDQVRGILETVFGKGIKFPGLMDFVKNNYPDMPLYENGSICLYPHDGDGGDLSAPFYVEKIVRISDLGGGKYAVLTEVHKVVEEPESDVVVGQSAFIVSRDPGSKLGFVVLSSHPGK